MNTAPLKLSPWTPRPKAPVNNHTHPITDNTLKIIRHIANCKTITSPLSPLTPLRDNPDFPPGIGNTIFQPTQGDTPLLAGGCYAESKFKDLSTLKLEGILPQLRWWSYLQLRSYLTKQKNTQDFYRPLTDLESVCHGGSPQAKSTSIAYSWLQLTKITGMEGHRRRWSEDLQEEITDKQWRYACILAHKYYKLENAGNRLQAANTLV